LGELSLVALAAFDPVPRFLILARNDGYTSIRFWPQAVGVPGWRSTLPTICCEATARPDDSIMLIHRVS
jgi:hypothetical protein